MRKVLFFGAALILIVAGWFFFLAEGPPTKRLAVGEPPIPKKDSLPTSVVAENLEIPWDIAFLPDGSLLVTERPGRLTLLETGGSRKEVPIEGVRHLGEGGLMGIALHPDFQRNRLLYLYFTAPGETGGTMNRVERYRFEGNSLSEKMTIIENIPGARYHDGGRIEFGPDGYLYLTTGDAGASRLAQDLNSLAGKILRLRDDGSIPADNPFGNAVWSYGHRNPQGVSWDPGGRLWSTEHGPSLLIWPNCCQDEVNLIEKGKNYGWPESVGDKVGAGTVAPALHSGRDTWAPASAAHLNGSLFFGGLKGEALYEAVLDGDRVIELKEHFKKELGRIRTVRVGPDGALYLTTSNRDDRGDPKPSDDKIIRASIME